MIAVTLRAGECLAIMAELDDASVDAIVTDPPYGLGFMGKAWDDLPPGQPWATECLRVLKPGGHLLAFGGTRTWHRLMVAVEDAGFEIRDSIAWLYGSGFPKSLDVSKAIDKAAGAERVKVQKAGAASAYSANAGNDRPWMQLAREQGFIEVAGDTPATDDARTWQGWGTALKPAFEPIVVARKPLIGTVAANVLAHGTGALNVDGCRIEGDVPATTQGQSSNAGSIYGADQRDQRVFTPSVSGRWPANVVLDESQAAELDEQSGQRKASGVYKGDGSRRPGEHATDFGGDNRPASMYDDKGGASRFFYVAKAPKKERPRVNDVAHPTVKPLTLMRWLVRLVTPPGGLVLDPFAGSGTTVEACMLEGFDVYAIERELDYIPLIAERIARNREAAS